MQISLQAALISTLSIAGVQCVPSTKPPQALGDVENGMRLVQLDDHEHGVITVWDHQDEASGNSTAPERRQLCSPNLTCNGEAGGSHLAPKDTCQLMISSLQSYPVAESPRSYCLDQNTGRCCVSWGSVPPAGTTLDMYQPTVQNLIDSCGNNAANTVSGEQHSASINNGCVAVCLSNRPKGCS